MVGDDVVIAIDGKVLAGTLPGKNLQLMHEWMNYHEDELYRAWNKAVREEHFDKIKPLE